MIVAAAASTKRLSKNVLRLRVGYRAAFRLMEALLAEMENRGVSRSDLARRMKVDRSTVTHWFSPGRNLTVFTAAMIADALGVELKFQVARK